MTSLLAGLCHSNPGDKKEGQVIMSLLKAGFNRRLVENLNEMHWHNELLMLEYNDVRSQVE